MKNSMYGPMVAAMIVAGGLTLFACSTALTPTSPVVTYAQLIDGGADAVVATLEANPSVSAAAKAQLTALIAQVDAANVAIQTAATQQNSAAQISQLLTTWGSVILPIVGVSSPEGIAILAAEALLPTLLQAAGISTSVPAAALATKYSSNEAMLLLHGYLREHGK